jgi:putative hydrolase of the HAD superfamily
MSQSIREIISRLSRPLSPRPTGVPPTLPRLKGIRAVLFDVYGTLFISGSGDVGTATAGSRGEAFDEAMRAVGLSPPEDADAAAERLKAQIVKRQDELRATGTEYPEVEIVGVWARTLESLGLPVPAQDVLEQLAIEYESRVNPVWPMPNCRETLDRLREAGLPLGIVSNAQFFTLELFPALLEVTRRELGFRPEWEFFSYRSEKAKPGEDLYRMAATALRPDGIRPHEALYVGNDLLNDVTPAAAVGFRTALFAGDARSLRLREDDARVAGVRPDCVVTDLAQLPVLLGL